MIEKWLHEIPRKYENIGLDYYVIMPNHIHLILILKDETHGLPHRVAAHSLREVRLQPEVVAPTVDCVADEPEKITVSDAMDWLKTMTTNEYIRMVKSGYLPSFNKHIWERSFNDRVIRSRDELYEIRKYIKNNPIKWMYVENQT